MEPIYQGDSQHQAPGSPPLASIDQYVVSSPDVRGGRPALAGTRISIADLVIMHLRMGQSLEEIAATYDLPLAAVHAGMAYYYDHRGEIDQSIEEDRAFAEAFRYSLARPDLRSPGPCGDGWTCRIPVSFVAQRLDRVCPSARSAG